MEIKNESDLTRILEKLAGEAIEKASKKVIDKFKKDYVLKYVYDTNPKAYERTWDFLNAWDWTPLKKEIKRISKEMWFNPGKITHTNIDDGFYQHGSKYSKPEIVIASIMEILDKKGRTSSLWLSNNTNRKEAYWQKFIEDMFDGGELSKIIEEEFRLVGFIKN